MRLARERRPELVLVDIQRPDIDGIAALRRIRAAHTLDAIPVLADPASVMPDEQQEFVASVFDAFITKPINLNEAVPRYRAGFSGERKKSGLSILDSLRNSTSLESYLRDLHLGIHP